MARAWLWFCSVSSGRPFLSTWAEAARLHWQQNSRDGISGVLGKEGMGLQCSQSGVAGSSWKVMSYFTQRCPGGLVINSQRG